MLSTHAGIRGNDSWTKRVKNIKVKAYIAMIAHNLKTLCTEPAPKFSRNSKKIGQLQRGRPKCLFGKIVGM